MNNQYIILGAVLVFAGYFVADYFHKEPLWGVGGGVALTFLAEHFQVLERFLPATNPSSRTYM